MIFHILKHTDNVLAQSIQTTFHQLRDLSQQASKVAGRFAQNARQGSQIILPDLKLAVNEREPALAESLLGMTNDWVAEMKAQGQDMQQQYADLQHDVHILIACAETRMKADRSCKLAQAALEKLPGSPRSVRTTSTEYQSSDDGSQSSDDDDQTSDPVPLTPPVSLAPASTPTPEALSKLGDTDLEDARTLRELQRVDEVLEVCLAFWHSMDGTVKKLAQMKDHTEVWINLSTNNERLRARVDQRLNEYGNAWESAERLCRQHCDDHPMAPLRMFEISRNT